jgi:hypothetical protein
MISPLPALSRKRNLPFASLYNSNLPAMLFSVSVTRRLVLDRCRLVSRLRRPCPGVEQAVEEHGSAPINWDRGCGPAAEASGRFAHHQAPGRTSRPHCPSTPSRSLQVGAICGFGLRRRFGLLTVGIPTVSGPHSSFAHPQSAQRGPVVGRPAEVRIQTAGASSGWCTHPPIDTTSLLRFTDRGRSCASASARRPGADDGRQVDQQAVAAWHGHDPAVSLSIYSHAQRDDLRAAGAALLS